MKELVILGPTASGKTALSIKLAQKFDGVILSLDSLSIYKDIDIASAKPTCKEREGIKHFGIDVITPDTEFNVTLFFNLYKEAKEYAIQNSKNLIIVGGTSFYLKAMLSGLSEKPNVTDEIREKVAKTLQDLPSAYEKICQTDEEYAAKITNNDSYRMEKWYEIYYVANQVPSTFLKETMKPPLLKSIPIYEIETDRDVLRERIRLRTSIMLENGLLEEIKMLESKYTRKPNCMKAIGIKEVLAYFDGEYDFEEMKEKIITNTARLAKRQRTFNKTQFAPHIIVKKPLDEIFECISSEIFK